MLENDANQARFIGPQRYTAQWNDDSHHGYHVLATGESDGYYVAYADAPAKHLARCLAEGFAYQGEESPFSKEPRGEPSAHLPPSCFVDFLQNHDQIGNRAFGERLLSLTDENKLKALIAIQLLAPSPPLLFMGEEWGCQPAVPLLLRFRRRARRGGAQGPARGVRRFASFKSSIPDPLAESTFKQCVLDWEASATQGLARALPRAAAAARARRSRRATSAPARYRMLGERAFEVNGTA